jgi:hypothetical protein
VRPQGWGVGSLDADADDLLLLSRHLRGSMGSEGLVIMGHSTGTQVSGNVHALRMPVEPQAVEIPWPWSQPQHQEQQLVIVASTRCVIALSCERLGPSQPPNAPVASPRTACLRGRQDAVRFCQRHGGAEGAAPLDGVILQAPVRGLRLAIGLARVLVFNKEPSAVVTACVGGLQLSCIEHTGSP